MDVEAKLSMIKAITYAIAYKNSNPNANTEEILQHVMKEIKTNRNAKIAAIVAASRALTFKEKNPAAKDKEILQAILNQFDEILESIKKEKEY